MKTLTNDETTIGKTAILCLLLLSGFSTPTMAATSEAVQDSVDAEVTASCINLGDPGVWVSVTECKQAVEDLAG